MAEETTLKVRELSDEECRKFLSEHHLGRIAYAFRDRVDIQPIFYAFDGEWLFGRTSPGEKLSTIQHHRWVAFEVDQVQDLWHWTSVVVKGAFHELRDDGTDEDRRVWERAREAISGAMPEAFTRDDPGAHRTVLFGISPLEITGRSASLG